MGHSAEHIAVADGQAGWLGMAAVLLTALALVPGGAHLAALPNKIALPQQAYFTVQGIYRGWAWFGLVLVAATLANLAHAARLGPRTPGFGWALSAGLLLAMTLAIFFGWTFPANQATANWTVMPRDWEALRAAWEWSHAANAGIDLAALFCATRALALRRA